jgi:hypothetical protein
MPEAIRQTVSGKVLAEHLGIATGTVRRLLKEGVFVPVRGKNNRKLVGYYDLIASIQAWGDYLRSKANARDTGEGEFRASRNRRQAAAAEREELELKLIKGDAIHAEAIHAVMTARITACKARVLAIPARCARQVMLEAHKRKPDMKKVTALLTAECELALSEIAVGFALTPNTDARSSRC